MMRRNLGIALLGVALGIAGAVALLPQSPAMGQPQQPKAQWEYRVVLSDTDHHQQHADAMTERFNQLAAQGWEYVGPVSESMKGGPYLMKPGVFVLFKRSK